MTSNLDSKDKTKFRFYSIFERMIPSLPSFLFNVSFRFSITKTAIKDVILNFILKDKFREVGAGRMDGWMREFRSLSHRQIIPSA